VGAFRFLAGGPGRLDTVVAAHAGVPRAEAQRAIAGGLVTVDGRPRPKSFRLQGGETVAGRITGKGQLEADPTPLTVRYEDDWLMVVSKPAGLVTHPTASRRSGTLVNRLLACGTPLSHLGGEDRPGIVHRLDAGTSGAIVVAKDDRAHALLAAQFRRHQVERTYLALVRGRPTHDRFAVDAPLGRHHARVLVRTATGKPAATNVQVRDRFAAAALVEVRPRTGRTHQIRVHLSAVGHPILGDRSYGGAGQDATALGLTRPFLHSWRVAFEHPVTGERVEVEDPLPEDLREALRRATGASEPGP
jgi:23S rRNA pseudouridine1911/1915/1917 synthase